MGGFPPPCPIHYPDLLVGGVGGFSTTPIRDGSHRLVPNEDEVSHAMLHVGGTCKVSEWGSIGLPRRKIGHASGSVEGAN